MSLPFSNQRGILRLLAQALNDSVYFTIPHADKNRQLLHPTAGTVCFFKKEKLMSAFAEDVKDTEKAEENITLCSYYSTRVILCQE